MGMELEHLAYQGSAIDEDPSFVARLPSDLIALLKQINGYVQFKGGLHVRGLCASPCWHSLKEAMEGKKAIYNFYPNLLSNDVPFAHDCMADQFFLRDGFVYKLYCETGEIENLEVTLAGFFNEVAKDPIEFLGLHPLLQYQNTGGTLQLGEVLHAFPPFCIKASSNGVSLKAIPVNEALEFLADFSAQINAVPEGASIQVDVTN
jgi:hypothetical protein